jgi:murein DD-endopeptidase MepM/ murein hydrolase activator NlpD
MDIFTRRGSPIYAPVSGVIIASADDWEGSWGNLKNATGGLGKLSGNGVILFNPFDISYYYLVHMDKVYAKAGDVVSRGDSIGTVGRTGNAASHYSRTHLHIAHKKSGIDCDIEGPLVAQNLFSRLMRARELAQKVNERLAESQEF